MCATAGRRMRRPGPGRMRPGHKDLFHPDPRLAKLLEGQLVVARLSVDRARGVAVNHDVEAGPAGIERGGLHAVVKRQADKVNVARAVLVQHPLEVGPFKP